MTQKELQIRLIGAFPDEPIPNGRIVYSNAGENLEADTAQLNFEERPWTDLSPNRLWREWASPFFMTDEAARYYLPSFLGTLIVDDDTGMADATALNLLERFVTGPFSDFQRETIQACLEYYIGRGIGDSERASKLLADMLSGGSQKD